MPVRGHRSPPLDIAALDFATVRDLARVLEERLVTVTTFGSCPTCHEAEARAFLVRLRGLLERDDDR